MQMRLTILVSACLAFLAPPVLGAMYDVVFFDPNNLGNYSQSQITGNSLAQEVGNIMGGPGGAAHAVLWNGTPNATIMDPSNLTGFTAAQILGTDGNHQVGYAAASDGQNHALMWSGSANTAVDLNPTSLNVTSSSAMGVSGTQQVGTGTINSVTHAFLWSGTAASAVDLHPTLLANFSNSLARATNGSNQVGEGLMTLPNSLVTTHALIWSGTAASAVDLNPANFDSSHATGISGNQQVGYGSAPSTGNNSHALLWTGSANSAVDLEPSFAVDSFAMATNGQVQVGYADVITTGQTTVQHAIAWSGTAASAVDLNSFLPAGYTSAQALAIDSAGNIGGFALDASGNSHAVLWDVQAAPEPQSAGAIALACCCLLVRRTIARTTGQIFPR